jgi:hypothetical protein
MKTTTALKIAGSAIAFSIAYSISIGAAQGIIHFQGAANEAATMLVSFMLGIGLIISIFDKPKS